MLIPDLIRQVSVEDDDYLVFGVVNVQRRATPRRTNLAYTPRQVVEQRGTVLTDYPVARNAAERFYGRRLPLS